jgi:hypothetical protein
MRWWSLILLTLCGLAAGGALGFFGGFFGTTMSGIRTDMRLACVLLQKAETAHYITRDQRVSLVDDEFPPLERDPNGDPGRQRAEQWVGDWVESWRNYMKSGCPDA